MKLVSYQDLEKMTGISFDDLEVASLEIELGVATEVGEDIPGDEDGIELVLYPKNTKGKYWACGGHAGYVTRISPLILKRLGFTDQEIDPFLLDMLETAIEYDLPIKPHCIEASNRSD